MRQLLRRLNPAYEDVLAKANPPRAWSDRLAGNPAGRVERNRQAGFRTGIYWASGMGYDAAPHDSGTRLGDMVGNQAGGFGPLLGGSEHHATVPKDPHMNWDSIRPHRFILEGRKPVPELDLVKWGRWMEDNSSSV